MLPRARTGELALSLLLPEAAAGVEEKARTTTGAAARRAAMKGTWASEAGARPTARTSSCLPIMSYQLCAVVVVVVEVVGVHVIG